MPISTLCVAPLVNQGSTLFASYLLNPTTSRTPQIPRVSSILAHLRTNLRTRSHGLRGNARLDALRHFPRQAGSDPARAILAQSDNQPNTSNSPLFPHTSSSAHNFSPHLPPPHADSP